MATKARQFWRFDNPMVWGIYASSLIAIFGAWIANRKDCSGEVCVDKYAQFLALPPNGIGDTLAGFAGALAFVWLITTVWLQGQELAEQREEIARMADAQTEQVKVLKLQGEIFKEEQQQRIEDRADRDISEMLELLVARVTKSKVATDWTWGTRDAPINSITIFRDHPSLEGQEKLRSILAFIYDVARRVKHQDVEYIQVPSRLDYNAVHAYLSAIERLSSSCSHVRRLRLTEVGFFRAQEALSDIIGDDRFWSRSL